MANSAEYILRGDDWDKSFDTLNDLFKSLALEYGVSVFHKGKDITQTAAIAWSNYVDGDVYDFSGLNLHSPTGKYVNWQLSMPEMFFEFLEDEYEAWRAYHNDGGPCPDGINMSLPEEAADERFSGWRL